MWWCHSSTLQPRINPTPFPYISRALFPAVMNIYVFYLRIAPHPLDTKHQVTWSRGSDNTDTLHWLLSLTGHLQHLGATLIGKLHHLQRTRNQLDTGQCEPVTERQFTVYHTTLFTPLSLVTDSQLWDTRGRSTNNIITRECKTQLITDSTADFLMKNVATCSIQGLIQNQEIIRD